MLTHHIKRLCFLRYRMPAALSKASIAFKTQATTRFSKLSSLFARLSSPISAAQPTAKISSNQRRFIPSSATAHQRNIFTAVSRSRPFTNMADSCEMNKDPAAGPVCSPDVASSEATPASTAATTPAETEKQEELPPLSDADFRIYNRMAERMDLFHNHFRHSWTTLWTACTTKRRPQGMSIRQFISLGTSFTSQLTMHHGIEEQHIFPLLARRMPEFRKGTRDGGIMVKQHREIHAGLEGLENYLSACGVGEADFDLAVLRGKMEGWGGVLWEHLDGEVKALGAENMRKYWSKQEMMRMPM